MKNPNLYHYNLMIPHPHMAELRSVAKQGSVSVAELMRRMHLHCLHGKGLIDRLLPLASGQIQLGQDGSP